MTTNNEYEKEADLLYEILMKEIKPAFNGQETNLSKFLHDLEQKNPKFLLSIYSFNLKLNDFRINIDFSSILNAYSFLKILGTMPENKNKLKTKGNNITSTIIMEIGEIILKFLDNYTKTKEWHYCQYDSVVGLYYVVDLRKKCLMTINSEDCMYKLGTPIGYEYLSLRTKDERK